MLNDMLKQFIQSEFSTVAFQGNPSSKKYRWKDKVFADAQILDTVKGAYNQAVVDNRIQNIGFSYSAQSDEAQTICGMVRAIAKENKKAHARHERTRREADVSGSLGDTLTVMNETPSGINTRDLNIFDNFRIALLETVREVYYRTVDEEGHEHLECLGIIADKPELRAMLAEAMAKKCPIDVAALYDTAAKNLASIYNEMQAMNDNDIKNMVVDKKWDEFPEFKSLYKYDLESVLLALISHLKNSVLPVLPWALHYVELYQVTSTKQEGEIKVSWRSGFKFKTKQGVLLTAKNYYLWALSNTEDFAQIERPRRFGDIHKIYGEAKPVGKVLKHIGDSPFLKAVTHRMTTNQMKVWYAFWYCVANKLPTPSLLQQDLGGGCKNGTVDVIAEGLTQCWGCQKRDTFFKLEREQLADKQYKYLVKSVGLTKRTILDYLFVFYDEIAPSKDMWENFKSVFGANLATINVRPLYVDPYTVEDKPVPCYMTRNSYVPLYEKSAIWRRLVVIRTDSSNAFLYVLNDEDRAKMDDPQVRADTFATILDMGKRAYEEITSKGGMLAINDIFPEIGALLGSSATDYESDMKFFYNELFKDKTEDIIKIQAKEITSRYLKLYPDQGGDKEEDKAVEMRLSNFLLGVDIHNRKKREYVGKTRPWMYTLHRNDIICGEEVKKNENSN